MASTAEPNVLEAPREWKDFLEGILPPQGAWTEEQYLVLTESSSQMIEFTDGYLEAIPVPTDRDRCGGNLRRGLDEVSSHRAAAIFAILTRYVNCLVQP